MGLFSWDCKGCGYSVRHPGACRGPSRWMARVVAIFPSGATIRDIYDGYGRIGARELRWNTRASVYHEACYAAERAHREASDAWPRRPPYAGASRRSGDQGHFVGEYDPAEPRSIEDVRELAKVAEARGEAAAAAWKAARERASAERKVGT